MRREMQEEVRELQKEAQKARQEAHQRTKNLQESKRREQEASYSARYALHGGAAMHVSLSASLFSIHHAPLLGGCVLILPLVS